MQRLVPALLLALVPAAAIAHTSLVPHQHPHELSALPDLGWFVFAVLAVGVVLLAVEKFKRGGRP